MNGMGILGSQMLGFARLNPTYGGFLFCATEVKSQWFIDYKENDGR
jgi:hypothetical protein